MQLALPVIMLLMIIAAVGALLVRAPDGVQPLDALTTSGIEDRHPPPPDADP
jgi:hypothetical protein